MQQLIFTLLVVLLLPLSVCSSRKPTPVPTPVPTGPTLAPSFWSPSLKVDCRIPVPPSVISTGSYFCPYAECCTGGQCLPPTAYLCPPLPTAPPSTVPSPAPSVLEPTAPPSTVPSPAPSVLEPSASPSPVPTPALSSLRAAVSAPPTTTNNGSDNASLRARTSTATQSSDTLYYTIGGSAFGLLFLAFAACMFWRRWRHRKTAFERWKEYDDAKTQGLEYRASNLQVAVPSRLIETELMTRRDLIPAAAPPLSPGGYGGDAAAVQTSPTGGFMYANDGLHETDNSHFGASPRRPTAVESNYNPMMFAGDSPSAATDAASDSQRVLVSAFARGGSVLAGQSTTARRLRPDEKALPPMAPTSEDPAEGGEWDKE